MRLRALLFPVFIFLAMACGTGMASVQLTEHWETSISHVDDTGTGLNGTGGWKDESTTLAWSVDEYYDWDVPEDSLWEWFWVYNYTLTVPSKGLSHFILETSDFFEVDVDSEVSNFRAPSYSGSTGASAVPTWGQWTDDDPSSPFFPDLPEGHYINGIKFDWADGDEEGAALTYSMHFESNRTPVWGDFYAKDGRYDGHWTTVSNSGFSSDPPHIPPDASHFEPPSTKYLTQILVPDTAGGGDPPPPVPGLPPTLLLAALPVAGIALRRFRGR